MRGALAAVIVVMTMSAATAAPAIYRGSSLVAGPPRAAPAAPVTVAGGRLWIIDPDGHELTGCSIERTTRIGQRRIRCTRGALP